MFKRIIFTFVALVSMALFAQQKSGLTTATEEMIVYREIMERKIATRQDLYDLMVMQLGEFDRYATIEARNKALEEKGVTIKTNSSEPVTRGEVSKALLQSYDFERGLWFSLLGWEFYALRDIQQAGIIESKFTAHQRLSGRQLIGIINLASEKAEEKRNYHVKNQK